MPHPHADAILMRENFEDMSDDELQRRRVEQNDGGERTPVLCDECGGHDGVHHDECGAHEVEEWAAEDKLHRSQYDQGQHTPYAAKKPMGGIVDLKSEEDDSSFSEPMEVEDDLMDDPLPKTLDLAWYFAQYSVDALGQIAVCRTHANNLAALNRVMQDGSTGARPVGRPTMKGTGSKGAKKQKTIRYEKE